MKFDITIVGGGFFGMFIAEFFALSGKSVLILEKSDDFMQRASFVNQARVHNGYHYPRSILTGVRSRVSFPKFVSEFEDAIKDDFEKYYLISSKLSKVNSVQFEKFCSRIGAEHKKTRSIDDLINKRLIEDVFLTKEYAFDTVKLKETMISRLYNLGVKFIFNAEAKKVKDVDIDIELTFEDGKLENHSVRTKQVFNCTYSLLNKLNVSSGFNIIPLRHEMTEMCLCQVPEEVENKAFTIMCGPFFSLMPFPSKKMYTLSHVRYTPHYEWLDSSKHDYIDAHNHYDMAKKKSNWIKMKKDAARYIPSLNSLKYDSSMFEIKTILPKSDSDDSRPILFKSNYGIKGFHCIMGGKIDNVYDVINEIKNKGLDL